MSNEQPKSVGTQVERRFAILNQTLNLTEVVKLFNSDNRTSGILSESKLRTLVDNKIVKPTYTQTARITRMHFPISEINKLAYIVHHQILCGTKNLDYDELTSLILGAPLSILLVGPHIELLNHIIGEHEFDFVQYQTFILADEGGETEPIETNLEP